MEKKIGFIGCGNMGKAMIGGIINAKLVEPSKIMVSDLDQGKLNEVKSEYGINVTTDAAELTAYSDIVVVSVKPNIYGIVLNQIKDKITADKMIVTIAAGITLENVEAIIGTDKRIVRTMPNTPALVNEGMSALCPNKNVEKDQMEDVVAIFNSFGEAEIVPEYLIDSVIGVSGSAPAYVFMFIEAMADAAVRKGMPRNQAYKFAAQAVLGSAKMVMETGKHPGELKDMVCSPGGTTIEAVAVLEKYGMRTAVIEAITACIEKSEAMTKKS